MSCWKWPRGPLHRWRWVAGKAVLPHSSLPEQRRTGSLAQTPATARCSPPLPQSPQTTPAALGGSWGWEGQVLLPLMGEESSFSTCPALIK